MYRIFNRRWSFGLGKSRRGMTLVELIVGIIVVGTAAVGTSIAIFNSYGQLQRQRHRMMANQHLRAEIEYWQGRIHIAMPTRDEMRNTMDPRPVLIDERDPTDESDNLMGEIVRKPISHHDMVNTPTTEQRYWEIPVEITYTEPSWSIGVPDAEIKYSLVGYWLQAEPTNYAGDD